MQSFVVTLLTCSVTMSALALFYMAVTPLLAKRYSEKGRYYAWLIIVIGLIIPFRPQFNNAIIKVDMPSETVTPIIQMGNGTPVTAPVENAVLPSVLSSVSWWQIAAAVWVVGMIAFLAYHAIKHYCFAKVAGRWSESIMDEQTLTLFQSLKTEMGISKRINLYLCSCIGSPMMVGFVNPRILLPKADLAHDELRFILKHELVHYKRKDLLYKYLVLVATAIHWFNPVVHLISKAIDVLCEISCDAEVIRNTDADTRQHYSEAIIGVVKYQSKLKTALSTNFYGGKKGMKNRIASIMDTGKKKAGVAIIGVALIVTMGTGFAFAASANGNTPQVNVNNGISNNSDQTFDTADKYAVYKEYGMTYDKAADSLYFDGKLVRYFEDYYPIGESGIAGVDYFNENGTIDVHAIRDLSNIIHNADGSYDPSGKLLGVEPYSQAEFDTRDIDNLKNPPSIIMASDATGQGNANQGNNNGIITALSGISPTADELAKLYAIYEPFGVSYDKNKDCLYYDGKPVRQFNDTLSISPTNMRTAGSSDGEIDIRTVRDYSILDANGYGKLTGIEVVGD